MPALTAKWGLPHHTPLRLSSPGLPNSTPRTFCLLSSLQQLGAGVLSWPQSGEGVERGRKETSLDCLGRGSFGPF